MKNPLFHLRHRRPAPTFIQLERRGNTFLMSTARTGRPLNTVELPDLSLNNNVFVGIYVCSHNPDVIEQAAFDNVRISKPVQPKRENPRTSASPACQSDFWHAGRSAFPLCLTGKFLREMAVLTLVLYWVTALGISGCATNPPTPTDFLGVPSAAIAQQTETLLQAWYPRLLDTVNGGYYSNFEYDWTRSAEQPKMLVTQARGLWTAARAARAFPDKPVFRRAADHGYRFLTTAMWDSLDGGFYLYHTDRDAPAHKLIYGNAFALYALSEYARINDDPAVKDWIRKTFQWMEEVAHDSARLGYYNIILPPALINDSATIQRIGWGRIHWKDQNTSIHLLEALTTTYEVLPEPPIRARLAEMLHLVRDTMVNPAGYLHLYFTADWRPIIHRDSSRDYILENLAIDHSSFGHDIETAYLLIDAAKALYGQADSLTLRVAKQLVDHTLDHGFDRDYYGLFDRGYRFAGADTIEIVDARKTWWAQAEAWHALGLLAHYYPDEARYPEAFRQMWNYLDRELIDHEHGGWYGGGLDKDPAARTGRKGHVWKGAYHDGRALMQVLEYAGK